MKKKNRPYMWHTRRIFHLCTLILAGMGFLTDWLICHRPFPEALVTAICPMLLAAAFYRREQRRHFLEQALKGIRKATVLNAALPMLLGSIGFLLQEEGVCLGLYLSISFLICVCVSEATLSKREDDLLSAMLWNVAVFYGMAVFLEPHAGAAVSIAVMSFILFLRLCWFCPHEESSAVFCKHFLVLTTAILFLAVFSDRVFIRMLDFWDGPDAMAFLDLTKKATWFGPAENLLFADADYRNALHRLAAAYGWGSLIPIALVLLVLLVAGMRLCFSFDRALTTLSVGCYYLLFTRILGYLALVMGMDLGITGNLPFFGGSLFARTLDFTMAAILLQPLSPPPLGKLDPEDPDFHALEEQALIQLPYNMDGLAQLCRYVYDDPEKREAWALLLQDYLALMDENTRRIMILNADCLFRTDYFRKTYPHIFACAGNRRDSLPDGAETECFNNSFLDHEVFFTDAGTRLDRYNGTREKLLIPPFYRIIAFSAFEGNPHLQLVSVPETVRRICLSAFEHCHQLKKAELRAGLREIGPFAFADSGLEDVNLPEGLRTIEENAFAETRLVHVFIPGSVEEISEGAFSNIPTLKMAVMYEGVRSVTGDAFRNCPGLTEIHIPDSLTSIAPDAFAGCTGIRRVVASEEWKNRYPDLLQLITGSKTAVCEEDGQ